MTWDQWLQLIHAAGPSVLGAVVLSVHPGLRRITRALNGLGSRVARLERLQGVTPEPWEQLSPMGLAVDEVTKS